MDSCELKLIICVFLLFLGKRSCKYQSIGNRDNYQNGEMNNVHFRGKSRVVCERTERVDCGMNDNTRNKVAPAIENSYEQKAYRNGKDNLAQIAYEIHAASVEQIYNVPHSERYA